MFSYLNIFVLFCNHIPAYGLKSKLLLDVTFTVLLRKDVCSNVSHISWYILVS